MEIWIGRNGERHGPYKEEDVRAWLRNGQVSGSDLAWREGLADWQPLSVLYPDAIHDAAVATDNSFSTSAAPLQSLPQTTAAALEDYAGFWKRFAAWIIDFLVLLVPSTIIYAKTGVIDAFMHFMTLMQSGPAPEAMKAASAALKNTTLVPGIIVMAIGFTYYVLLEGSKWQATLGKLALGIRVTDMEGHAPGFARCAIRNAVRLLNAVQIPFIGLIPFFSYIATAWTARKQGWHDMAAKALVLNGRASEFKDTSTAPAGNGGSFNA
ncbi:RDD family protein [Rhodanobacter sp. DHB23]|uniref:RDD family protein n=1 Tax=Rhodanobacter sp. DHB23 TaxID=2775923 RepID=UPI00177B5A05|nr:RDD family protein [Rhodanobacter sp. DHB23]MBD8872618.1 RDD family protein [Rhodanobacter sp. DHB23]